MPFGNNSGIRVHRLLLFGDLAVDGETSLRHNLLQITIRERMSQVPTNTQEDDHTFEMPPAEQCLPFSGHNAPCQISSIALATEPFITLNPTSRRQAAHIAPRESWGAFPGIELDL
jgi:hypothetical protein